MRKISSGRCNICNLYTQDIHHLLFDCLEVRNFWYSLEFDWNCKKGINIKILKFDVFFGHESADRELDLYILYAKYYLFKNKELESLLNVKNFDNWYRHIMSTGLW